MAEKKGSTGKKAKERDSGSRKGAGSAGSSSEGKGFFKTLTRDILARIGADFARDVLGIGDFDFRRDDGDDGDDGDGSDTAS